MTAREAMALLGLTGRATPEQVKAAFKTAVKAARPDTGGGDPERFRQVIEAYRLLQRLQASRAMLGGPAAGKEEAPARPTARAAAPRSKKAGSARPEAMEISIREALEGVARSLTLEDGRSIAVRLPAGLRQDDVVRLKGCGAEGEDLMLRVRIRPEAGRAVIGGDVCIEAEVCARVLAEGGRVEIDTPRGRRSVWIPKAFPADGRLRLGGEGLPMRGDNSRGDLYVRPIPREAVSSSDGAQERLRRFAAAWTEGARFG